MLAALVIALLAAVPATFIPDPVPDLGCVVEQKSGWTYCFTERDYRWLARAIDCETGLQSGGPDGAAVAWTMLQRLYLQRRNERAYTELASLLQAYCRCINPDFATGGKRSRSKAIRDRVDWFRGAPLYRLRLEARKMAAAFTGAGVPNLWKGFVHFDLPPSQGGGHPEGAIGPYYAVASKASNVFWRMPGTTIEKWSEVEFALFTPTASDRLRASGAGFVRWFSAS